MDFVILKGIPMPPSANNAFFNRKDGLGRARSGAYRQFERDVAAWSARNSAAVQQAAQLVYDRPEGSWLTIDAYFSFPRSSLVGKTGKPKQLDVDNRLKILNDALSKVLAFNDCIVASQRIEKVGVPAARGAWVDVLIRRQSELLVECPWPNPDNLREPVTGWESEA